MTSRAFMDCYDDAATVKLELNRKRAKAATLAVIRALVPLSK